MRGKVITIAAATAAAVAASTTEAADANITMLGMQISTGGCGASATSTFSQPYAIMDGTTCNPLGGGESIVGTCTSGTPSVSMYISDTYGFCNTSTPISTPYSNACQSFPVVMPGSTTTTNLGFAYTCTSYAAADLMKMTTWTGPCGSGTDPLGMFMLLNQCQTPPSFGQAATVSYFFTVNGTLSDAVLTARMWVSSGTCSGSPDITQSISVGALGAEAQSEMCTDSQLGGGGGGGGGAPPGRRLQSGSTTYTFYGQPSSLTSSTQPPSTTPSKGDASRSAAMGQAAAALAAAAGVLVAVMV